MPGGMREPIILFLKAAIPGGAAFDLFAAPVMVAGHVRKDTGTYVAPHISSRRKRRPETPAPRASGQPDLFTAPRPAARPAPAEQPSLPIDFDARPAAQKQRRDPDGIEGAERPNLSDPSISAAAIAAAREARTLDWTRFEDKRAAVRVAATRALRARDVPPEKAREMAARIVEHLAAEDAPAAAPAPEAPRPALRTGTLHPLTTEQAMTLRDRLQDIAPGARVLKGKGNHPDLFRIFARPERRAKGDDPGRAGAFTDSQVQAIHDLLREMGFSTPLAFHTGGQTAGNAHGFFDVGRIVETSRAKPPTQAPEAAAPAPDAAPEAEPAASDITSREVMSSPAARPQPYRPAEWGMPRGVKASQRVKANKAAEALLAAKTDEEMTDADLDILARYSGWGGCGTSPNEYFTPPAVAGAIWSLARTLGFRGGEVLEPSAGTGVFQQAAPDDASLVAVELSTPSARINALLHRRRGDEVHQGALEGFAGWDQRKFDLVIGNPPFGPRGAFQYDDLADGKAQIARAEQYFLDTALDKAKDGGLVALVLPSGVMDNGLARDFRARILAKGQLLAAFRLPNTAFEDSHTQVTTDILVFRKRPQAVASALAALTPMQQAVLPHWNEDFVAGRYMTEGAGAANILGTLEPGWRAKAGIGDDITVAGSMEGLPEHIAGWQPDPGALADDSPDMASILATAGDRRDAVQRASDREPYPRLREGQTKVVNGILYVLRDHRWHRAEQPEAPEVAAARTVGALLEPLIAGTAADPALARARVQEALDEFQAQHGNPARLRALLDWTSAPQLPTGGADAAEHAALVTREARRVSMLLGAVKADGTYSDVVTGRAAGGPAAGIETMATHLATRDGDFTPAGLAAAAGTQDVAAVEDFLHAHAGFARLPGEERWTSMDQYLSGELWPKHDAAAKAAADADLPASERERFRRQADALLKAIGPMDLGDVTNIQIDSPFIPLEAIAAFKTATDPQGGEWTVREDRGVYSVTAPGRYGYGSTWDDLLERLLMRRGVRKDEEHLVDMLHTDFREWLLSDPEWRQKVEDRYNRTFRGFVPRAYSDEPIPVPGLNPDFDVHPFQWKGVRWAMERGKGIIAADVGVGKTPRGLILNALMRSTGRAKKPVIVMPKSLLANWYDMVRTMFPEARTLTIGETITEDKDGTRRSKEDNEEARRRKLADLSQNDYDFVLMTMPAWNLLNLEQERADRYAGDDFFTQRAEALAALSNKKRRAATEKAEAEKKRTRFVNRGEQNITLEATGIDAVILDEGHSLKNLATPEAGAFRDLKFLGAPGSASKQAANSAQKFRYIRERNDGQNVFLLTATPTKNSPLEIYSMMQHVAPEVWTGIGIRNADDFISRFVETTPDTILGPSGEAVEATVVSGFRNLDEVRTIARRYIDRTTAAEVGLKLPTPEVTEHAVEMDAAQAAAYAPMRAALDTALKSKNAEGADHPFSIMSDMQKAATDMRLYQPDAEHAPSPKLRRIAENAAKMRSDGGQLIFCDYVDGHGMLRDLLVAQGVDPKRIGIINAEATPSSGARQKMGDRFNAGELDILIGNTATMGEGLNLQKRTADIHHTDIPWEPASMIQRNGRGLRQGNRNQAIRLHSYITKGSFDGYRWQSMMAKSDWQTAFWGGADAAENTMRRGGLGRLEMLIMASADPDAARQAFTAQLEAARDRMAASKQAEANRLWHRYREAKRQYDGMRRKREMLRRDTPTRPEQALAERAAKFRAMLDAHPEFPWKDAIDAPHVAIDAKTGRVWRPGDEVEVAPGSPFRTGSTEPEPYVVTSIDELNGKVMLLPAGYAHLPVERQRPRVADLASLREGVSPTKIDREAAAARQKARDEERERAATEARAAQQRAAAEGERRAAAERVQKMLDTEGAGGWASINDLHTMGPDFIRDHAPALRTLLRRGAENYSLPGRNEFYALEAPDGSIRPVASHELRKAPADHVMALPTPETRAKLVEREAQLLAKSRLRDLYWPVGRGGRGGNEYRGARRDHAERSYGESPTMLALRGLQPEDQGAALRREVAARADQIAAEGVRAAPTFALALARAGGGFHNLDHFAYGGLTRGHLQPETRRALLEAAERLGVADKPWRGIAGLDFRELRAAHPDDALDIAAVQRVLMGRRSTTIEPDLTVRQTLALATPANTETEESVAA